MFSFFKKKVYLDYGASTPILKEIKKDIFNFYKKDYYHNVSSIYDRATKVKSILESCRQSIANNINARAREIIFTSSGTEAINLAIRGFVYYKIIEYNKDVFGYKNLESILKFLEFSQQPCITINKKVVVLTTNIEHPALLETLFDLRKKSLIDLYILEVEVNGVLNNSLLRAKIEDLKNKQINVDLISIMYVNNEIGTIQNIKEYGRTIDEYNRKYYNNYFDNPYESQKSSHKIVFMTDACQAANYLDLDIRKLKADMMIVNSSKVYGSRGAAILYKNKNIKISPILTGGGQEMGMRSGTENINSIYTFAKALELISNKTQKDKESQRLRYIQSQIHEILLKEIPNIKIWPEFSIGVSLQEYLDNKVPNNINFSLPGINSDEMIIRLDHLGFEVSHKSACDSLNVDGSYVLRNIGATDTQSRENIRITMGRYTNLRDMYRFVIAVKSLYFKYKN